MTRSFWISFAFYSIAKIDFSIRSLVEIKSASKSGQVGARAFPGNLILGISYGRFPFTGIFSAYMQNLSLYLFAPWQI